MALSPGVGQSQCIPYPGSHDCKFSFNLNFVNYIDKYHQTFKDADLKKIAKQLKELNKEIKKIIKDTAQIKECVETGENCVPPEGETADRSDKDTADDIIWVVSMYQNTGDRCYPHVSYSVHCTSLFP